MDKAALLCKVDTLVAQHGAEFVLENICKGLSQDVLESSLKYLCIQLGTPLKDQEDEEDADE